MFLGLPDPSLFCNVSGSFHEQAKKEKKTCNVYYFVILFNVLSMKTDVNVPSKSYRQKKL
jgi:hypothetical protein